MKLTNTEKISEKVAKILLESGCVTIRTSIPFRFTSGMLSPIYVDNRRLISLPKQRSVVTRYLIEKIKKIGTFNVIAGTATAGIPYAAWIAAKLYLPMVYVRLKPKEHGQGNQVEGIIRRGQKVLVVEDMVSTAQSSKEAIQALRKLGAKVEQEIAIYSHGLAVASDNFKKIKVNLICLATLSDVVKAASKYNYLVPSDETKTVLAWAKNPKGWGKKMGFE